MFAAFAARVLPRLPCVVSLQLQAELAKNKADLAELRDELKSAVKREAAKVSVLSCVFGWGIYYLTRAQGLHLICMVCESVSGCYKFVPSLAVKEGGGRGVCLVGAVIADVCLAGIALLGWC